MTCVISYPPDHPKVKDIERWSKNGLGPGYIEYLLKTDDPHGPHCIQCRNFDCENSGEGDDACGGFQYGEEW